MHAFGDRLKFCRIYILKMQRQQFCEEFGFALISLQSWENKTSNISTAHIDKLISLLKEKKIDYNQEWLFSGIGNPFEIPQKDNGTVKTLEMPHFGDRLKFFRMHILKLQRIEFCARFGFAVISIQSWENKTTNISQSKLAQLKKKLDDAEVTYNHQWLFEGMGHPYEQKKTLDTMASEQHNASSVLPVHPNRLQSSPSNANVVTFFIENTHFEPLYSQNTTLVLAPIPLHELRCPAFIATQDSDNIMQVGIITESWNKGRMISPKKGTFDTITLTEKHTVYVVKGVF
jgi:DNA-binding transcriptional regulator YiaG